MRFNVGDRLILTYCTGLSIRGIIVRMFPKGQTINNEDLFNYFGLKDSTDKRIKSVRKAIKYDRYALRKDKCEEEEYFIFPNMDNNSVLLEVSVQPKGGKYSG